LKIILTGPAYPLRGGIANFNESLCSTFHRKGIDSEIVSFSMQYPSLLFPGKTQKETEGNPPPYSIKPLLNSINPFSWIRAAWYIRKSAPDCLVVMYWTPFMAPALGTLIRLVKRKKNNIRIIPVVHNLLPHEKVLFSKKLAKYFGGKADTMICLSASVYSETGKVLGNIARKQLYHPIYDIFGEIVEKDKARDYLNINKDTKLILFFGIVRAYKGLDLLLTAMADPRIQKLNLKLIVAGEFYEKPDRYLEMIRNNSLEDRVILTNSFIPREKVKYYFSAADIVVQPYHSATQSGVTQIAYQFERPMLVTNVGGLSEIVKDGRAGYVTPVDPEAIATALDDFYSNQREAEFVEGVKEGKKYFSWDRFADEIIDSCHSTKRNKKKNIASAL